MNSKIIAPFLFRVVGTLLLLLSATVAQAEIAVIAHKSNTQHGVSVQDIADMYVGKLRHFSNGKSVKLVEHRKGSEIRKKFNSAVLNMSEREISRYWSKRRFTGKIKSPKSLGSDRAIREWVADTPEGLGYIDGKSLDGSVKLLLIIP